MTENAKEMERCGNLKFVGTFMEMLLFKLKSKEHIGTKESERSDIHMVLLLLILFAHGLYFR